MLVPISPNRMGYRSRSSVRHALMSLGPNDPPAGLTTTFLCIAMCLRWASQAGRTQSTPCSSRRTWPLGRRRSRLRSGQKRRLSSLIRPTGRPCRLCTTLSRLWRGCRLMELSGPWPLQCSPCLIQHRVGQFWEIETITELLAQPEGGI